MFWENTEQVRGGRQDSNLKAMGEEKIKEGIIEIKIRRSVGEASGEIARNYDIAFQGDQNQFNNIVDSINTKIDKINLDKKQST